MSEVRWLVREFASHVASELQRSLSCPPAIARILASRGIAVEDADGFLHPTLAGLHRPMLLSGMNAAVARIQRAVSLHEKILIYGDYDVDGTTAIVLLKTAIERIGPAGRAVRVSYHVPHRIHEGYGMRNERLAEAANDDVSLVISVDTGIRAFAQAEEAKALGLDLIVTDHHLPDGVSGVPDCLAVINPAQPGCAYPNKELCGAGVAFKLAHALLAAHAATDADRKRLETVLIPSFLKLVSIATIADSVPLTGENRAIAWLGLRALANPVQPGLRALMEVAKIALDQPPTASEVGFRLAPRINAAGRMDVASDVVELFLTRDPARAKLLAAKLDELNTDRRAEEAAALDAIEMQLMTLCAADGSYPRECIVLDHPEWHRGVLGILASRVVERTHRPALVLTSEGEDSHGSGRSIPGFHLLDAITAAQDAGPVFHRFGGHAHAVGFSLPTANLSRLREGLRSHAAEHLRPESLVPALDIDAEVAPAELASELFQWLERLAPFGHSNPEPVLLARSLALIGPPRIIKDKHISLPLTGGLSAMGWSRAGHIPWSERIQPMHLAAGSRIDAVFRLRENRHPQYGGLELDLIDLKLVLPDGPAARGVAVATPF
jgi:single-stranded-DNA-specific exonuclease